MCHPWTHAITLTKLALARMQVREAVKELEQLRNQLLLGTVRDEFIRIAVPVSRLAELTQLINSLNHIGIKSND